MRFLSLWQRLAHHYFGWDYVSYGLGYSVVSKRGFTHKGKIYVYDSSEITEIPQERIIFTTIL